MKYHNMLQELEISLALKKKKLEEAKIINRKRQQLQTQKQHIDSLSSELFVRLNNLKFILAAVQEESAAFASRRINYLGACIDEHLACAFPTKGFYTELIPDVYRGKKVIELNLKNRFGNGGPPSVRNGKMCMEIISFSASACVADCLATDKIYSDEAFAASSVENLTNAGRILKSYIDRGFQIFLVEQKPDVYKDLPRHEIHLINDPETLQVVVDSYKDY